MNTRQRTDWWIGVTLFTGFIATFFLDLAGVAVHQLIGLSVGALAAYHLFLHFDWVVAVTTRLLGKTSGRAQLFYALDSLLVAGLFLTGLSGLVISTWLKLSLDNHSAWVNFHITTSIATLAVLSTKLALHWRWIVRAAHTIWETPATARAEDAGMQPVGVGAGNMGRREFLQVIGVVGALSFLALVNSSRSLARVVAAAESTESEDLATKSTSDAVNSSDQSSSLASGSSCMVQCRRACSYPGHCHRYIDTNGNNRCDLGECA